MTYSSIDQYNALPPRVVEAAKVHMDAKTQEEWRKLMNSSAKHLNTGDLGKFINPTPSTSSIPKWAAKTSGNKDGNNVFGGKVLAEYAESYSLNMDANGTVTYDIQITQEKFARLLEGRSHMEPLDTSFLEEQLANYDDQLDKDFIKGYLAAIEVLNERKYLEDYLPE